MKVSLRITFLTLLLLMHGRVHTHTLLIRFEHAVSQFSLRSNRSGPPYRRGIPPLSPCHPHLLYPARGLTPHHCPVKCGPASRGSGTGRMGMEFTVRELESISRHAS